MSDHTLSRMAGNIAAGMVGQAFTIDEKTRKLTAKVAVALARDIEEEIARTEPTKKSINLPRPGEKATEV